MRWRQILRAQERVLPCIIHYYVGTMPIEIKCGSDSPVQTSCAVHQRNITLTKPGPLPLRPVTASKCFSAISSQMPNVDTRSCTSSPSSGSVLAPRENTDAPLWTSAGVLGINLTTLPPAGSSWKCRWAIITHEGGFTQWLIIDLEVLSMHWGSGHCHCQLWLNSWKIALGQSVASGTEVNSNLL